MVILRIDFLANNRYNETVKLKFMKSKNVSVE